MKLVEQDLDEMLQYTHRRWINEKTPQAEAAFNRILMAVFAASRDSSSALPAKDKP